MRVLVLLFLLLPSLVDAQVEVCCGANTDRPDLPGRTNGFDHNLQPLDAVRFGQLAREHEMQMRDASGMRQEPEASYPPYFGLYNLDEGGYNPGTGSYTPSKETNPEWYKSDKEWASQNLKKYWNTR